MDKWLYIAIMVVSLGGAAYSAYQDYNKTKLEVLDKQIELARIQNK